MKLPSPARPLPIVRRSLWMEEALDDDLGTSAPDILTGPTSTDVCIANFRCADDRHARCSVSR